MIRTKCYEHELENKARRVEVEKKRGDVSQCECDGTGGDFGFFVNGVLQHGNAQA